MLPENTNKAGTSSKPAQDTLIRRKTIVRTKMLRLAITALVAFSVSSAVLAVETPPVAADTVAPEKYTFVEPVRGVVWRQCGLVGGGQGG